MVVLLMLEAVNVVYVPASGQDIETQLVTRPGSQSPSPTARRTSLTVGRPDAPELRQAPAPNGRRDEGGRRGRVDRWWGGWRIWKLAIV